MNDAMLILCAVQEGHISLNENATAGRFLDPSLTRSEAQLRSFAIDLCARKGNIVDADTRRLLVKLLRERQPGLDPDVDTAAGVMIR